MDLAVAPTAVEPLSTIRKVDPAPATVLTEEVAKVAPVLSVSTAVRVHELPPLAVMKATIGIGPVSPVSFPFSGYSEATSTAVPFTTAPPFE